MSRKKKSKAKTDDNVPKFPDLNLEFADDTESDATVEASGDETELDGEDVPEIQASDADTAIDAEAFEESTEERDLDDETEDEAALNMAETESDEVDNSELSASETDTDSEMETADTSDDPEMIADSDEKNPLAGSELGAFESAAIEDVDVLTPEQIRSVVESVLFSTDKPLSIAVIKQSFKGTQVRSKEIREALNQLEKEYQEGPRGFMLAEAGGGFQLRTKADNLKYLRQSVKVKPFRLSGPALEVLSIVAYKQPVTKNQIDEIRGVESGHLLRALMEKSLIAFGERSDLPGKPMYYESTRKFLEIFGLRNLAELPSISEIDQLLPEGIGEPEDKETLGDLTGQLSRQVGSSYSEGEDELIKITDELTQISTSSDFFEQEKQRQRDKRDQERAQDIREATILGNPVEAKDQRWLERYEAQLLEKEAAANEVDFVAEDSAGNSASAAETDGAVESGEAAPAESADLSTSAAEVESTDDEEDLSFLNEPEPPHEPEPSI